MPDVPVFRSKVDRWIAWMLVLPPLAAIGVLVGLYRKGGPHDFWVGWAAVVLVAAIYGGLLFPMRYELREDVLVLRFGLVRYRVPYTSIRGVQPTSNPMSSPALSLDRLHIDAGSSLGPNISPADKQGFLAALAAHTPHLRLEGDRLVPRDGR